VTANGVRDGFRAVGAGPGDTLFYHGSLSSMGWVDGGAAAVLEGALAAVAPGGTAAMPTLWYHESSQNPADFDPAVSPTWVGRLAETFRTDPRSRRSNDFSHSISAIGPRAEALTADHEHTPPLLTPWSLHAFSDGSPWFRLYQWNALYAFIGVALNVCTMKHYIEARCVAESLARAHPDQRGRLAERIARLGAPGVWPWIDMVALGERLAREGLVMTGSIGAAPIRAIRTRPMVDRTLEILRQAPRDWFKPDYLAWRDACLARDDPAVFSLKSASASFRI